MRRHHLPTLFGILGLAYALCFLPACGGSDSPATPADGDPDGETETETEAEAETEAAWAMLDYVDPLIGTGGKGYSVGSATPGASLPFGLVNVGPESGSKTGGGAPFYHCGGYHSDDVTILGFAQVHLHGVGATDLGNILFQPILGPATLEKIGPSARYVAFSHADEMAGPGYYTVTTANKIKTELTATTRVGYHRYTFPSGSAPSVVIDLSHTVPDASVTDSDVTIDPATQTLSGFVLDKGGFTGRYGGLKIYYAARFSKPFAKFATSDGASYNEGAVAQAGPKVWIALDFARPDDGVIEAQVAISYVSVEGAKANLAAEMTGWDFASVKTAAEAAWAKELSPLMVWGGTPKERRIMATAFYHTMLMPQTFMDADGQYLGFDKALHKVTDFVYYTNFSMWDTYRTAHPLYSLLLPEKQRDFVRSLLTMAEDGGYLPKWPMGAGYTNCMLGTPADIVIADAYVKGIRDYDAEKVYAHMKDTAENSPTGNSGYSGRSGIEEYKAKGYVSADVHGSSVSLTQEYAIADNAIAQMAAAMGKTADAAHYAERAKNYRNHWYADKQLFLPRKGDGSFIVDFSYTDTMQNGYYSEGDPYQYNWLAPHDDAGLRELFGGAAPMLARLTEFFEEGKKEAEKTDAVSQLLPLVHYWQANEPDIHAAYLFLAAGRPDLAQKWVRWIMSSLYNDTYNGITGNDDAGTMSAWYVFSALGLYPVSGTTRYWIGTPLFERAELKLMEGTLIVEAPGVSATTFYVQGVTLNGTPLTRAEVTHEQLVKGGVLHFTLGDTPSLWGRLDLP